MLSDPRNESTRWQTIREVALERIRSREWAPGTLIPTEIELAAEFGCARATVNRALRELAATGLLDRRRKAGTRVAVQPSRRVMLEIPVIKSEVEEAGGRYGYQLLSRRLAPAPASIRQRMGRLAKTKLLHLRALHLCDDAPYIYEDRWVNPQAVPAILDVDLRKVSANLWLVRNVPYTRADLTLHAAAADAEIAAALVCEVGTAVLVMERATWLESAAVTLVRQCHAPGYRLTSGL